MPKTFMAQASDLAGPTNPTGIWSPSFLVLKRALDTGEDLENLKQALYDWLGQRRITADQVDQLLDLEPEAALAGLLDKIGAGLKQERLPPVIVATLRRALASIAQAHVGREEQVLKDRQARLDRIKSQFVEGRSPSTVVGDLLR